MAFFNKQRLGIDLGTSNTVIYIENKGIALREPSIVAQNKETNELVAFGREAESLVGRTSDKYEIIRPMRDGVIANFSVTKQMLAHFINQAMVRSLSRPEVVVCVPSQISKVEKRAVIDAIKDLGISRAMVVEEPFAAALGANLAIYEPRGKMVVDIGGGTTDVATLSYGQIVTGSTTRTGGGRINEVIMDFVRNHYHLAIGYATAEQIKKEIGNAQFTIQDENLSLKVKGRNIATGIPDEKVIKAHVISQAIDEVVQQLVLALKHVLEQTPPELSADIMESGIVLTGGGALLKRLPDRLHEEIGIPVHLARVPMDCVALGTGKILKEFSSRLKEQEKKARL
ncbi:rod shape-determining protein [Vaginisenegalia massiliensis]|uniref:rod shape-determining protein n=1 Tax=Vaginisenegalia massiliensis TaxID=2058294 RepID=UPI000F52C58F|nr:rod shape-determining protein [Vaginisenegalia massiliensis]